MEKKNIDNRAFSKKEINIVKDQLTKRREVLWKEIMEDLENDAVEEHREYIDIIREHGDMALEELRESTAFSLIELKYNELKMIEEALNRIKKGEYGRCLDCNGWINPERLKALPYAVRCRDCQSKYERLSETV